MGEGLKRAFEATKKTRMVIKRCQQCGAEFETERRRKCADCRRGAYFGRHNPEKLAAEEARRKLPSMTMSEVQQALTEGRRWFTNGGTRWRYVIGFEGFYIGYASGRGMTMEFADNFAKWAKAAHKEKGGEGNG